jgi:hypothetical protein
VQFAVSVTVPLFSARSRQQTYVRDDRPFAETAAPAAAFFYSSDRGGVHPDAHLATYAGLMQADAAGFNRLYETGRKPRPITAAMCWAHARRKFFDVARLNKAPIAIEAVARIAARGIGTFMPPGELCRAVPGRRVVLALPSSGGRTSSSLHSA